MQFMAGGLDMPAMLLPMMPRPMKPTFSMGRSSGMRRSCQVSLAAFFTAANALNSGDFL